MENADKIITAYSILSIPQAILLGSFLIIVVSLLVWLISSYGISFKNFKIGGSKKILDASRHDSFLKEELSKEVYSIEQDLRTDLRSLIKRKKHELIKILDTKCFFASFAMGSVFEETLFSYACKSDFVSKLSRGNKAALTTLILNKLLEEYKDNELRIKSAPCEENFPPLKEIEDLLKRIVLDFFEESTNLCESSLEKTIKLYEEFKSSFKDPFYQENACEKSIKKNKSLLESIQ